uniref:Uncharacterized protein n=1 Tax=Rhizophora mucronata TaxID=61149 RepID=A0A2P2Q0R2_RHIMU
MKKNSSFSIDQPDNKRKKMGSFFFFQDKAIQL